MKLHYSPTSPYVRKVLVTALLGGTYDGIELVRATLSPITPSAEVQKVNPIGKIPALLLDDDTALYDSPVICEYLDSLSKGPRLVPVSGPERWRVLTQNALADGLLEAAQLIRAEALRPDGSHFEPWLAAQRIRMENALRALDAEAVQELTKLTLGSVAAGCALGWLDFRMPDLGWRERHARLASWYEGFANEWFMRKTAPA